MRTFLSLFIFGFLTMRPALAERALGEPAFDIADLMAKCENDIDGYQSQLRLVRSQLNKEIAAMTDKEYKESYKNNDPRVIFLSLHWPRDLESKDKSWGIFDFCAKQNWETLKALGDSVVGKSEKAKKVALVESCVYVTYYKNRLVYPLDRLVACYKKQSRQY